ncbi:hypothetical protein FACS1894122_07870 [Alphaproteobacteria bacterium]|nr:hypothetical protein FACS1894122_07870 [Alphaproteobacteria bacterium]
MTDRKLGNNPFKGTDTLIRNTSVTLDPLSGASQGYASCNCDVETDSTRENESSVTLAAERYASCNCDVETNSTGENESNVTLATKSPKINITFQAEAFKYIQLMSGFDTISVTKYINNLILDDMRKRSEIYEKLKELKKQSLM